MAITQLSDVLVDQTAYNLGMDYALRPELYFDAAADVKPTAQAHPGSSVKFTLTSDLAAATTALTETSDVTPVAMADSQVTVTLAEYGNAVQTSAKLRGTSFVAYDPVVANVIGYNAGISLDTIARTAISAGTNVLYVGTDQATTAATDLLIGNHARRITATLRTGNVPTFNGSYLGYIHPHVAYDFKKDTAASSWLVPSSYSAADQIWNGDIGTFEGIRFIETPRAVILADAGATTVDVYESYFMGRQALAKAYSYTDGNGAMPTIVPGPVTDLLRRFVPLGWYWLGGYAVYRQASLYRYESASSIGAN